MPSYEYECGSCRVVFEELLISSSEIQAHSKSHPCPACGADSPRVPSAANFAFAGKAGSDPTSGRSSSGSHDLDYPSLDKAIGRSANRKWKNYEGRKKARDDVRRATGSVAITETKDGSMVPTPASALSSREQGLKMFKKARDG